MTSNCTCEALRGGGAPANSSACAEMLKSCGGGGGGAASISVGITLVLLLAVCGLAGFWGWKHPDAARRAFPRCLRGSGRRRSDYSQTHAFGSVRKAPGGAQGRRPAAREAGPCDDYENLDVGPRHAEEADPGLYENARPACSPAPDYGDEASSSPYYNFQSPASPETPQEEDIYILPD